MCVTLSFLKLQIIPLILAFAPSRALFILYEQKEGLTKNLL